MMRYVLSRLTIAHVHNSKFLLFQAPDDKSIKSGKQLLHNCRKYNVYNACASTY